MRVLKFRGKVLGSWEYVSPENDRWPWFWALVDRETVGQYIGLDDKKGTEVYEGDILMLGYSDGSLCSKSAEVKYGLHRVGYDSDAATGATALGFYFSPYSCGEDEIEDEDEDEYSLPLGIGAVHDWEDIEYSEVIGNVHDNPKLLAKEESTA